MLGATTVRVPYLAPKAPPRPTTRGTVYLYDPRHWVAAYGRRTRCPYGGSWPYCREPAGGGAVIPRVSGLGIVAPDRMPGAFAPALRNTTAWVGTGPRRPPPPPLRTGLRGLGQVEMVPKLVFFTAIGGALFGLGLGYFVYGR